MQVVHHKITFDIEAVVAEEVPFMSAFYRDGEELNNDIRNLLAFPLANQESMPFYTISDSATYELNEQFEKYYAMMKDALLIAFNDEELLRKYFDCRFLREHGDRFVPYAKATFKGKHPALYGRYDACFGPDSETLRGIYEFNGDTPVMLFESVNLQNRLSKELGTDQYNNYWHIFIEQMKKQSYREIAVVCSTDWVEDVATCETLLQGFREALPEAHVQLLDIRKLDFDHANIHKPWVSAHEEHHFDAVYILSPWEEMVSNFPEMLGNWERWINNVHLYEPAWRWFFAHKGMTALCWHLLSKDDDFWMAHGGARILPTYLSWEEYSKEYRGFKCVQKPVVGRLSNNIKILDIDGSVESDTGGYYDGENCVYQYFMAPDKVDGRNNFILGMWMCGEHAASLCAREFDTEVLSISNERWIPHIVVED